MTKPKISPLPGGLWMCQRLNGTRHMRGIVGLGYSPNEAYRLAMGLDESVDFDLDWNLAGPKTQPAPQETKD